MDDDPKCKAHFRLGAACYVFTAFSWGYGQPHSLSHGSTYHPSLGLICMESIRRRIFSSGGGKAGMMLSPIFFGRRFGGHRGNGGHADFFSLLNRQLLQTQVELWKRYTVQHVGRAEKTLKKLDFLKMKVCSSEVGKDPETGTCHYLRFKETFIFWPLLPRAQEKGFALFYPLC